MNSHGPVAVIADAQHYTPSCPSPAPWSSPLVASSTPPPTTYTTAFRSEDEPVTVNKATPALHTTQDPASGTVGASFKDKATISGLAGAKPSEENTSEL